MLDLLEKPTPMMRSREPLFDRRQQLEVGIRLLEAYLIVSGARHDQEIRWRHGDTRRTCATCELVGTAPYVLVDSQFWQDSLKISQYFFFSIAASAIPEFKSNHGAPASLTRLQRALHPLPHRAVTRWAKQVDPR